MRSLIEPVLQARPANRSMGWDYLEDFILASA
jgi:hypothetical protein